MKKKKVATGSTSTAERRKRPRRVGQKSVPKKKEGLILKDYLLEEHPELGFPVKAGKQGE